MPPHFKLRFMPNPAPYHMLSIHSLPSHFLPLPARRLREYISEHARAIRAHTRLDVDNALTSWTVQQVGVSAAQVTARVPQRLSLCLCMGVHADHSNTFCCTL